jgi:uncharacterized protein DUF1707
MRHNERVIDYTDPTTAQQRLSHSERDDAVAALAQFAHEGRLTDAEAAQRSESARSAVTRGDLAPLFSDLPTAQPPSAPAADFPYRNPGEPHPGQRPWRYAAMSLSPFIALALFFVTGNVWGFNYAWLWFLLIPVAGIITYGAGGWGDHDRYRDR